MKYIDDPKLLDLRFSNGMLILPYFYGRIMAKLNNQSFSSDGLIKPSKNKIIFNLLNGLRKVLPCRADILCITNSRWESKENEKWKNIQHGYYSDLFPQQTLLLETSNSFYRWKTLDTSEKMSTINEYFNLISGLLSKICVKVNSHNKVDYESFNRIYPFISVKEIKRAEYVVKVQCFLWKLLLKYIRPKVILMHCGSYGDIQGVICKVAHELGITPIDTQHGQVYRHKVYMASEVIRNSHEYMEYMPDYFYSFGIYWSNCVDWNYKKVEVGNPHLNEYVRKYASIKPTKDFLVISQPTSKEQQYLFIKGLAKVFPQKVISVRLHPFEDIDREKEVFKEFTNIEVSDSSENLYAAMCRSKKVIGWCSTCLSELLAFKRMPIIVNTSLANTFPRDLGIWVDSPEDVKKISDNIHTNIEFEKYWNPNFELVAQNHLYYLLSK